MEHESTPKNAQARAHLDALLARRPVMLAPMEDVTDVGFRALCREMGADLTFTEFVNVEMLLAGAPTIRRKIELGPGEGPRVGIQIYGANPATLVEAAEGLRAAAKAGCAGVMIGRAALNHPWIFREVRQLMADEPATPPSPAERLALCRRHLLHHVAVRGEKRGVMALRRHLQGYLS